MTSTIARAQHADASALRVLKLAAKPKPSGAERDRLQKLSGDATSQIKDDAVREAFLRLAGYFRQRERLAEIGQGQAAPVQDLLFIGRFGMVRTAEFAASQLQNELQELPLEQIIGSAPSAQFVEPFAKRAGGIGNRIAQSIAADAKLGDSSAAMDWLVRRGKPAEIAIVAALLVSNRERLPHLISYPDLLPVALKRDKGAVILQSCLRGVEEEQTARERLIHTIADDPKLVANLLKAGPKLLRSRYANFVPQVLQRWATNFATLDGPMREPFAIALGSFWLALLKRKKRAPTEQHLLDALSTMCSDALRKISASKDSDRFWIVAKAADLVASLASGEHVTPYGAGLIASTLEKAAAGMSGQALVEALASNVGMTPIGSAGEQIVFNPEQHEDTSGGLLPNDVAVIKASGWSLGDRVIRRAAVAVP